MAFLTLSTCTFCLAPEDYNSCVKMLETAMDAGFDGFEIDMYPGGRDVSNLIRALKDTRVPVVAVHGILGPGSCSPDRAIRQKTVAEAAAYLEKFTGFAPCPVIEHYWNRFNAPEIAGYFHETSAELLKKTEELNFIFCMENAPYKPEHNERYPFVDEVASFARSFGENRMFMCMDINHLNLHENPVEICRKYADLIKHIHISDNHGLREEHLPPGQGIIDLPAVYHTLTAAGFTGPCNLEMIFPQNEPPTAEQLRQVAEYCRKKLLQEVEP